MLENSKILKLVFLSTVVVVATLAGFFILYKSSVLFLSALIGIGLACLLIPVVQFLKNKWSIPSFLGALLIMFALVVMLGLLFFFAGSVLVEQLQSLKESFPGVLEKWQIRLDEFSNKYPKVIHSFSNQQPSDLTGGIVSYFWEVLKAIGSAITGITLAFVVALFMSVNYKQYTKSLEKLFPKRARKRISHHLTLSAQVLRKWFVAQLLDMLCVALLTTIGLWAVGVSYWALYGLLAGVMTIVPYVGILSTVVFAGAIVAVLQPDKLIALVIVFVLTQQIEGNFILPKLMKDHVQVPAIPLIFLMILAGVWLGVLGIFVTPPLMAICIALYVDSEKVSV